MKNRAKHRQETHTFRHFHMLIIGITIGSILIGGTLAKYIEDKQQEAVYAASSFYFKSDLLTEQTDMPTYTYPKGQDTITLQLQNFEDALRFSEVDITYEVEITDTNGTKVVNTLGTEMNRQTGILKKGSQQTDNITFSDLPSGTYVIKAHAMQPYAKTVQAQFVIEEANTNITYHVSDAQGSAVLQVTIVTQDYAGNVYMSWPEGVIPDNTNPKLRTVDTANMQGSTTIAFEANAEYTFSFFKTDPNRKYAKEEFQVEREEV